MTTKNKLDELKKRAKDNKVPIIQDDGLAFLIKTAKDYNVKHLLEIGAAIGFSTINLALLVDSVDTFERNELMLLELNKNIKEFNLETKIKVFPYDALEFNGSLREYDLIFIDAAKAQYEKFFSKFTPYLRKGGVVVCDNLNFHNLKENEVSRQTRALLRKISNFKEFLKKNSDYNTTFNDVGDGMSVSIKL